MKVDTYKCDNCGAARKEANHWFRLFSGPNHVELRRWDTDSAGEFGHVCGQECAFAMLTRWIATGKFERFALVPGSFEKKGAA